MIIFNIFHQKKKCETYPIRLQSSKKSVHF